MMPTAASTMSPIPNSLAWLRDLLREESSPYPGRGALVARMVSAARVRHEHLLTYRAFFCVS